MKIVVRPSKYGKRVTVIIPSTSYEKRVLKAAASRLKQLLAVGGTVKNNEIILQGDHSDKTELILEVLRQYNIE